MPGKIELCFNSRKLAEYPLDKEVLRIGRRDDNDVKIDNLAVSGHHARLFRETDDWFLEDLDSTNGTFVNGRAVKKHPLRHGDSIVIGKHELRYARPADTLHSKALPTAIDSGSSKPVRRARLQILNGRNAGKEMLLEADSVRLGKPGVQMVSINRRPDGHFLVALEQAGHCPPLRVNGLAIGARACKLRNHDIIDINELKIEYYLGT
ncbi:MAG: hypothetical protein RLZZ385_229 [Pseudomonadota bacterium]|jgi:hypothetical protein